MKNGSGYDIDDSVDAYDTRGSGFVSSHLLHLLKNYLVLTVCRKDTIKKRDLISC